jgi:hypothetical protein
MLVAKLRAICKPCWLNLLPMCEVAIFTENIVIPALGAGMMFKAGWLEYPPEYLIQYLSVCLPLLIQLYLINIAFRDPNWQDGGHYNAMRSGPLADL